MKALVYSSISSGYDSIKPGRDLWFFDSKDPMRTGDPCRGAKWPKVMLHRILTVEVSIYLDGSIRLNPGIDLFRYAEVYLKDCDMAVMKHPSRDCLYAEAQEVLKLNKEPKPQLLKNQVSRYAAQHHPRHCGLAETGVMFRRHTRQINNMCDLWWTEIEQGSRRDQVSFPFALRATNTPIKLIDGRPFFTVELHS